MNGNKPRNEKDLVIREAIVQLFALQLGSGTTLADLRHFAQECVDSASRSVSIGPKDSACPDVYKFGSVLRTWHRETRYLSKDGFPRPLSVNGQNGLRRLVCTFHPTENFESVLAVLRKSGLLKKNRDGKWFPTEKHAVFPLMSAELLAHLSAGVSRYVETVTRNVTPQFKDAALFERSSAVRDFPTSSAPAFREFVQQQALAFLGAVDDWLEARVEASSRSRARKCSAGVFTFAFLDDFPQRKKARIPNMRGRNVSSGFR